MTGRQLAQRIVGSLQETTHIKLHQKLTQLSFQFHVKRMFPKQKVGYSHIKVERFALLVIGVSKKNFSSVNPADPVILF
jgi:hypothetical protein